MRSLADAMGLMTCLPFSSLIVAVLGGRTRVRSALSLDTQHNATRDQSADMAFSDR